MQQILETERLKLRELTMTDTSFIVSLVNSPGWLKYIGDRNIITFEDATIYLENGPLKSYKDNGFGLWLIEQKKNGEKIGICGLIKREGLADVDIGFAILPEHEGKGYALEIAAQTLAYGKEQLRLPRIVAITNQDNERSVRLLNKLGMHHQQNIHHNGEEMMLFVEE